ncbi:MAG: hypothetical protein IT458_05460 [Planctomycetes bacterium]|nr:hypothetical protein [Planctomycetota bacterium]
MLSLRALLAVLVPVLSLAAQSNGVSGLDCRISNLGEILAAGRTGTYPNGLNGLGGATTICNIGTVQVDWYRAMDPRHPFIATIVARESDGRMVQISDRSYVKHGFTSTNTQITNCGTCQNPGTGDKLGLYCTDTYSASLNANSYYLAPPDEVDPFLGTWNPVGSHFDRGEPDVGSPANRDGVRSLTNSQVTAMGPIAHRVKVSDQDLVVGGARFYYQAFYVITGELEAVRGNSLASREFTSRWDSGLGRFVFTVQGATQEGTVLARWTGATVTSAANGADDGRYYVAVKVSGPVAGLYHYEFAIQNRDNRRGANGLRIPICSAAEVRNVGFRDVDALAANDWSFTREGGDLVFRTSDNPLLWNTIYNVWFDSDAAPASAPLVLEQHGAGPGAATVSVASQAPLELANLGVGPGCGAPAPRLYAAGNPARALLGNQSFGLVLDGVAGGAACVVLLGHPGSLALGGGCTAWLDLQQTMLAVPITAGGSGVGLLALPVPNSATLEGTALATQGCELQSGGAWLGQLDFSNGLKVRVGSNLPGCP